MTILISSFKTLQATPVKIHTPMLLKDIALSVHIGNGTSIGISIWIILFEIITPCVVIVGFVFHRGSVDFNWSSHICHIVACKEEFNCNINQTGDTSIRRYHDKRTQVTFAPLYLFQLYHLHNGWLHKRLKVQYKWPALKVRQLW